MTLSEALAIPPLPRYRDGKRIILADLSPEEQAMRKERKHVISREITRKWELLHPERNKNLAAERRKARRMAKIKRFTPEQRRVLVENSLTKGSSVQQTARKFRLSVLDVVKILINMK